MNTCKNNSGRERGALSAKRLTNKIVQTKNRGGERDPAASAAADMRPWPRHFPPPTRRTTTPVHSNRENETFTAGHTTCMTSVSANGAHPLHLTWQARGGVVREKTAETSKVWQPRKRRGVAPTPVSALLSHCTASQQSHSVLNIECVSDSTSCFPSGPYPATVESARPLRSDNTDR